MPYPSIGTAELDGELGDGYVDIRSEGSLEFSHLKRKERTSGIDNIPLRSLTLNFFRNFPSISVFASSFNHIHLHCS